MDRGEFQQDSVLKQLEVLKEEEKEFQNLKVSWILPLYPVKRWGRSPRGHSWHPGVLGTPPRAHYRAEPAHAPASTAAARLSLDLVPSGGVSQRTFPVQGERLCHAGIVPAAFRAYMKVWCQDRGMQRALVSRPGRAGQIGIHWWHKRTLLGGLVVEVSSKGGL